MKNIWQTKEDQCFEIEYWLLHLADCLKLDEAWRRPNKHDHLPIFPSFLPSCSPHPPFLILYMQHTFSLLNGIMIKAFVATYCVCPNVSHTSAGWILICLERRGPKSKTGNAEAARKCVHVCVRGGNESENRKHGKERKICTVVPAPPPLPLPLSTSFSLFPFLFLCLPWSLSVRVLAATKGIGG